ncbi:MAG: Smr/MutS family protein [Desulfovibrionaceae bacterium]|nr:Smr/MutS family protein [Desulfovibrionaceae bacterium]
MADLPAHAAEGEAFRSAMADVTPLPGKGRAVVPEAAPQPGPAPEPRNPLQELVDGKVEFSLSGTDEFMEGHVVGLDLLTVGKLQARQYSPEAHIDLHGLNSEQAFQHLVHFFRGAYYKGVRTALVVTGRGLNSPNGIPVLRSKVQEWLTQEPFRRVILAFCTARREDGGPGALYVLLRKYRKNSGKVRWDAMPADPDLFL